MFFSGDSIARPVGLAICLALLGCGQTEPDSPQVQQELEASGTEVQTGWPTIFGPYHHSISPETGLDLDWPEDGPPEFWRKRIGAGYSVPVLWEDGLILFHRLGDEEIIECLDAETGESLWDFRYPTADECQYEYSAGPYSTPVIEQGRVFAIGAEGKAHVLDLETGELIWRRGLARGFSDPGNALWASKRDETRTVGPWA